MIKYVILFAIAVLVLTGCARPPQMVWRHISTANGELDTPWQNTQQTSSAVFDVDMDGINDFIITERTGAPSVVWYRRVNNDWDRYVIDDSALHIEAGSAVDDVDGDGDPDVVFGGDSQSNNIWWWENPYPDYDPSIPWQRHIIKNSGATKHHDQIFGDFNGDGVTELVFWNQNDRTLYLAEKPGNVKANVEWPRYPIYSYETKNTPEQRGVYPAWKTLFEHEGLCAVDMNHDGVHDIVGGGHWFEYVQDHTFTPHPIDDHYTFSRCTAGQLIPGGYPEVVLVVGDGRAPLVLYQWEDSAWTEHVLIDSVQDGHSLDIGDFDGDGYLDIFNAEMQLGDFSGAKIRILYGDGTGHFTETVVDSGYGLHESRIADLDGDGDFDILGKPYNWKTPRLDIWLNETP